MEQRTDPAHVQHPRWCLKGEICTGDGIHHSKPLTVVTGDAYDLLRLWLEQAWTIDQPSIVLEVTTSGEVHYGYLPIGQGRVLRHQLTRLLDMAKDRAQPRQVPKLTGPSERAAEPGEVCTCGRPAVKVFTGGPFGDTGYCGLPDGGQAGPCPFCGGPRHQSERCPQYRLRPAGGDR
ncbi:hypothetical protein M2302_001939 [Micromonospora sp. A200]|uniref:hypothetical protein n=1 Tax=Micromonospora sp. A200 TaxID=2940568 RepID=UPI002473E541|nr:hypothetical protein [Micromonospora sp. A200]MDH6461764.1 hypothetical protein [Micromonospora sp. A200]